MKEKSLKRISAIDDTILDDQQLEKLIIEDSSLAIPETISKLQGLKEFRLQNSRIGNISPAIFKLKNTFCLFENNTPAYVQDVSLLLFDLQWGKITKAEAIVYLHLLQKEYAAITLQHLQEIIHALDYRIEDIRLHAIDFLDSLLSLEGKNIEENSCITITGKCTTFSISEIKKRLKNVKLSLEKKLGPKTNYLILGVEPNLDGQRIDLETIQVTTERSFKAWLDLADEQFLNKKTEENEDAIANISDMLLSKDSENIKLAMQMMKIHGVSKDLLTALFILYNDYQANQGDRIRAKNLFKKNASKELLEYVSDDLWLPNTLHAYKKLQKAGLMDAVKIAFHSNKDIYEKLKK